MESCHLNYTILNEIEEILFQDENLKKTKTEAAIMQEFEELFSKGIRMIS